MFPLVILEFYQQLFSVISFYVKNHRGLGFRKPTLYLPHLKRPEADYFISIEIYKALVVVVERFIMFTRTSACCLANQEVIMLWLQTSVTGHHWNYSFSSVSSHSFISPVLFMVGVLGIGFYMSACING